MSNKLLKKLQMKPGHTLRVMNGPRNLTQILGDIPVDLSITEEDKASFQVLLLFARDSSELETAIKAIAPQLGADTVIWVAYPKKNSGIPTDLNLMTPWQQLQIHGLGPVASVAIDEVWTGIRLKRIEQIKASGLCNDDIEKGPYAEFVDVTAKQVTPPPDLAAALAGNKDARTFFESLSYSNRKEYVLWLLSAKQEKTRVARLGKTIDKLEERKKNPSEK